MKIISWSGQGACVSLVLAVLGYRADLLPFRLAFALFLLALLLCVVVVFLGLCSLIIDLVNKRPLAMDYLLLVVLCSIGPGMALFSVGLDATKAPMIHDITSDTLNPPVFIFTQEEQGFRENSLVYGADELSAEQLSGLQLSSYPDIRTMTVELPARTVYQKALFVASFLGWEISAQDVLSFHFEAQATTAIFGFVDDIVVRITPLDEDSTAVDIRSVSRLGTSDLGANANRIQLFFDKLGEELIIR
ncbi:hypothetical protein U062_00125 [Gammaproteobacteria bacterium MOLA455]|nr:hypothetical protein U062_00125 [Gammaproteobacteria bacterium MOLA455]